MFLTKLKDVVRYLKEFDFEKRLSGEDTLHAGSDFGKDNGNGAVFVDSDFNSETDKDKFFEHLVDEYSTHLLRLSFMYLKDRSSAEDAVQDTFVKVYKNLDSFNFEFPGSEKAWLSRIAVNVCKDMLRSAWNRKVSVVDELEYIPCDDFNTFDDSLIKEVMKLKTKYREVILLFYYEDMKISEISELLGTPESTVSVRLKRAREQLKIKLKGWYDE